MYLILLASVARRRKQSSTVDGGMATDRATREIKCFGTANEERMATERLASRSVVGDNYRRK